MEKIFLRNEKEQFVPAEFSLLLDWAKILEKRSKGIITTYLQLQTGINRDVKNSDRGYTWLSVRTLARLSATDKNTIVKRIKILEELGFILKERGSKIGGNKYRILAIPALNDKKVKSDNEEVFNEVSVSDLLVENEKLAEMRLNKNEELIKKVKKKELKNWNVNDFLRYFSYKYFEVFKSYYSNKDLSNIPLKGKWRKMLDSYGNKLVYVAINYTMDNWKNLFSKNGDFPDTNLFFLKKNTIFTAVKSKKVLRSKRYRVSDFKDEEVGFED